jgi:hypothetical protein
MAASVNFDWNGVFTVLDTSGAPIKNTSLGGGPGNPVNWYQTPVSGTLALDTSTGAGSATVVPFPLVGIDAFVSGFQVQTIGDGMGNPGTLLLGNLLLSFGPTSNGTPVSMVMDAAGLFVEVGSPGFAYGNVISGVGAIPATDGTYVGTNIPGAPSTNGGFLELGPTPIATTAWNTSLAPGCAPGDCLNLVPSGALPLVLDTVENLYDSVENTGAPAGTWGGPYDEVYGVAGSPMVDGPFQGSSIVLDITTLVVVPGGCDPGICEVPVPAAVWLFGSGLVGLIGFARRRS